MQTVFEDDYLILWTDNKIKNAYICEVETSHWH